MHTFRHRQTLKAMNRWRDGDSLGAFLLLLICFIGSPFSIAEAVEFYEQDVIYQSEEAGEVYITWGVDGWLMTPKKIRRPETVVSESLLYTRLTREGATFRGKINVPVGSTIDYLFWTSQMANGDMADIYSSNHIHTYSEEHRPIDQKAPSRQMGASGSASTLTDFITNGLFLMLISALLWTFTVGAYRLLSIQANAPTYTLKLLTVGLSAYLILLVLRIEIFSTQQSEFVLRELKLGYEDSKFLIGLVGVFLALGLLAHRDVFKKSLYRIYLTVTVIAVCAAILNVGVVNEIGRAFNFRWLYFSGFLNSVEAKSALSANLNLGLFLNFPVLIASLLFLSHAMMRLAGLLESRFKLKQIYIVATLGLLLLLPLAAPHSKQVDRGLVENPIVVFIASTLGLGGDDELYTMTVPEEAQFQPNQSTPTTSTRPAIQNILLVVLESTPAQYLDLYGGQYAITPHMNEAFEHALVFENIYAHAPSTNKSLLSLFCSIYPISSHISITNEAPKIKLPSISSELSRAGYRTSFLTSANAAYMGTDKFIKARSIDLINDYSDIECSTMFRLNGHKTGYGIGVSDGCLPQEFERWVAEAPEVPFLSVIWTNQAHYPYFVSEPERDFKVDNMSFNRYLNALHEDDKMIGDLIERLKSNNLYESTVIVIIGDHGEAFRQHGKTGHASGIYEENVRIPMILINPILFNGERDPGIGEMIDVAPTILDLVHRPIPTDWHGESLLNENRSNAAFFFSPWSDFLYGARIDQYKLIIDQTNDDVELYDLSVDPEEKENLAKHNGALTQSIKEKIAGWLQHQTGLIDDLFGD